MSKKGKEWRARRKLRDPVGWRAKQREKKRRYFQRYPEKLKQKTRRQNDRSFEQRREVSHLHEKYGDNLTIVYAIQVERFVKVGITSNLKMRVSGIETDCPFEVKVIYQSSAMPRFDARRIEVVTHAYFVNRRTRGEWFEVEPRQVVDFLSSLSSPQSAHIPVIESPQLRLVI